METIKEKAKAYDGNYKAYTELINRLENVKDAIKKQNYGIAMDILCKPYPEYQIITSIELKEFEDDEIRKWIRKELESKYVVDNIVNNVMADKALAWLERQGKNSMGISEATKQELEDNLNKVLEKETPESFNKFLDEQDEQKPAEDVDLPKFESYLCLMFQKFRTKGMCTNGEIINYVKEHSQKLKDALCHAWSEEDERFLNIAINVLNSSKVYTKSPDKYEDTINWLKSLKEKVQSQPKQEWKQENTNDLTDFENAMMHIGGSFFGDNAGLDPNDTKTIKEQANLLLSLAPKQEWSEEDEKMLEDIRYNFEFNKKKMSDALIAQYYRFFDKVKSLKPQPKQEWSEKDKCMLNNVIDTLKPLSQTTHSGYAINSMIDWLKSLRPQNWTKEDKERYISCLQKLSTGNPEQPETINSKWFKEHVYPQATWKPSDEQMITLRQVISGCSYDIEPLVEIEEYLKKLKE